ncbi:MAG: transcriptional repressor [Gammaproteobacteria bacterium]|nr:transcriptional repressor [Gammaproteobacteria bacterium]
MDNSNYKNPYAQHAPGLTATRLTDDRSLEDYLLTHGVKVTRQRLELARLLFAKKQHLSADHLIDLLAERGRRISKATVYNTLSVFVKQGLLKEVSLHTEQKIYDSNVEPHHHFYNTDTGQLTDVTEPINVAQLPAPPEGTKVKAVEVVIVVSNS